MAEDTTCAAGGVKTIEMIGADYEGVSERTRTSCRGIVLRDGKLLLSYETSSGLWMIPGGGLEPGEDESDCCIREVIEETGYVIEPSPCALRIEEKYKRWGFTTLYFFGRVTGTHDRNLTEREAKAGMEPRWIPVAEAKKNFAEFEGDGISELRRILYRREYTALCALFPETEE